MNVPINISRLYIVRGASRTEAFLCETRVEGLPNFLTLKLEAVFGGLFGLLTIVAKPIQYYVYTRQQQMLFHSS